MNRDRRPVVEQVKSGFRIVGKMLVAFAIAVTFMAGFGLIRAPRYSSQIVLGSVLIMMSILVMTTTVRFWAAGFFGFIAYGALRSLGGVFVADAFYGSRPYMAIVSASAFAMGSYPIGSRLRSSTSRLLTAPALSSPLVVSS